MKIIWEFPFATHSRFLESLSPVPHLESVLTGRYLGFLSNFLRSDNLALVLICSSCRDDLSTKTGLNIRFVLNKHKMGSMLKLVAEKKNLKKLKVYTLPEEEQWKVSPMK